MGTFSLDCFDEFTCRFFHAKVHKLIGQAGFTESDRLDLLQEFALDLIKRRKNFNPNVATWEAFVVVVGENCTATILEHRHAEMRSPNREGGSLNRPVNDADGSRTDLGSTVPDTQQSRRTGHHRRTREDTWDLAHDVAKVLDQMPPQMRTVCKLLLHKSKAAAARELGCSPGSLYEIHGRILARFEKAGLRDYLK